MGSPNPAPKFEAKSMKEIVEFRRRILVEANNDTEAVAKAEELFKREIVASQGEIHMQAIVLTLEDLHRKSSYVS